MPSCPGGPRSYPRATADPGQPPARPCFLAPCSAFCIIKGFLICFSDTVFFGRVSDRLLALGLVTVVWLFSLLYATDAGLSFMETVDYYINFMLLLVGLS